MSFLRKFLVFSIFLSMLNLPSYAGIIGGPKVDPKPDDVCAYHRGTTCYWVIDPDYPDDPGMCVDFPGEDVVCSHTFPCGQPHASKKCNPAATNKAECTLVDSNVTCRRVPKPTLIRGCSCRCKNAAGEVLDQDWNPIFTQTEPFTQSCQEKYVEMMNSAVPAPVPPEMQEEVTCRGWTKEVEDQVDADYEEWKKTAQPGDVFPFPPKQDGTMQCEVMPSPPPPIH